MPKFRKKPVVVEAVQWKGSKASWDEVMAMGDVPWKPGEMGTKTFYLETLSGWVKVEKGFWVIKGVNGEFYPCKPDIFEKTYYKCPDLRPTGRATPKSTNLDEASRNHTFKLLMKELDEGNIIIPMMEDYGTMELEHFITQPIEGMLYDLALLEEGIDVNTVQGVRLFAIAQVIRALKERVGEHKIDHLVGGLRFDKIASGCVIPYLEKLSDERLEELANAKGYDIPVDRNTAVFAVAKMYLNDWENELPEGMSDNDEIAKFILDIKE